MSSTSSNDAFLSRTSNFVSENKRALIIGAAVAAVAVGGIAYYNSTSPSIKKPTRKPRDPSKPKPKRKTATDEDGPILEEILTPEKAGEHAFNAEEIAAMDEAQRTKLAAELKSKGNNAYNARSFMEAIDYYTQAIAIAPTPLPVFYSNRAACYVNMTPPQHEQVVSDCDEALKLDPNYVKALSRRAGAYEGLQKYEEALRDYTAATILDKFQNQNAATSVERVLKKLATEKAAEIIASRDKRLPSHTFISSYFAAFRDRPIISLPETEAVAGPNDMPNGDNTLIMALNALQASSYVHALSLVNESIELGLSWDEGRAEALNLRGTFKFLAGDIKGAQDDLLASIALVPSFTQSWVKVASVYMEQGDPKKAFECFDEAIKCNANDPDIYYHRGQVLFIMNEFQEAVENYVKSTALDDQFVFSQIQLAVAQYKMEKTANSMATFRRTLKAFPTRSEPQNYYGELLLDQQHFSDAVEKFDRAIELERERPPPMNVLPLVNKGLALYQWKQDVAAAERCCQEALRIDDECEAAVATLAQLKLQQSKIEEAVELFKRQAQLARSEPELVNALTYQYASASQVTFLANYPQMASQLSQIARSMVA